VILNEMGSINSEGKKDVLYLMKLSIARLVWRWWQMNLYEHGALVQ
jgi:hypothetical protein